MRKFLPILFSVFFLFILQGFLNHGFGQQKTVKVKQVKELPTAYEYVIVWEGGDYKETYYEVKNILDGYTFLQKQVFLWKMSSISAIISKEKATTDVLTLFRSHGFQAIDIGAKPSLPTSAN